MGFRFNQGKQLYNRLLNEPSLQAYVIKTGIFQKQPTVKSKTYGILQNINL